ncbi:MAG TPA: DUF6529 family protein [Acidimicrobiia bacterium]|nr:DUF6529 family protein [Acidimicrobiia bacterium]
MSTVSAPSPRVLWYALLLGGGVAVAVGVYGSVHDPAGQQTISLFFSNTLSFKAWTTTAILLLALIQLFSALRMWGKVSLPKEMPGWFGDLHRLSGTLAFALSLPLPSIVCGLSASSPTSPSCGASPTPCWGVSSTVHSRPR